MSDRGGGDGRALADQVAQVEHGHGADAVQLQLAADQNADGDENDHGVAAGEGAEQGHHRDDAGDEDLDALVLQLVDGVVHDVLKALGSEHDADGAADDEHLRDHGGLGDDAGADAQQGLPGAEGHGLGRGEGAGDNLAGAVELIGAAGEDVSQQGEDDDDDREQHQNVRHGYFFYMLFFVFHNPFSSCCFLHGRQDAGRQAGAVLDGGDVEALVEGVDLVHVRAETVDTGDAHGGEGAGVAAAAGVLLGKLQPHLLADLFDKLIELDGPRDSLHAGGDGIGGDFDFGGAAVDVGLFDLLQPVEDPLLVRLGLEADGDQSLGVIRYNVEGLPTTLAVSSEWRSLSP